MSDGGASKSERRTDSETSEGAGLDDRFRGVANRITQAVGAPSAMLLALLVVVGWAVTGPVFGFSDTWQLVINTGTTIVTFLMVFAIQNSQNREARAMHLKLDELIRATKGARNRFMTEEDVSEAMLEQDEESIRRRRRRGGRRRDQAGGT